MDIKQPIQGVDPKAAATWNPTDRVIIIGGGAAGISCAYTLEFLKVPYILLEADDIHGGRVKRNDTFLGNGTALDIGAEWIHTDPSILKDLVLVPEDKDGMDDYIRDQTIVYQPQTWGYLTIGRLWRMDFLKHTYQEHKWNNKSSWSQFLDDYMVRHLDQKKVVYNAIVKEIDYSSPSSPLLDSDSDKTNTIKVTCQDGKEYVGTKVVCAVPLSILKDGDITFVPALPSSKQKALKKADFKPGLKMAIEFKKKFFVDVATDQHFLESVYNMVAGVGAERYFFDALHNKGIDDRYVMGVYCYSTLAAELSKLDDEDLFQDIMKRLDRMYDGQATENYIQHIVQNWTREPFIRGASSSYLTHDLTEREFGQAPLDDKVFFAGEYAGGSVPIAVHSACLSGRRAAMTCVGQEYKY
eukprot:CAMPEP_0113471502 /NCGR_PEP_ID=MMETSP0014_2-20120614/17009_1 /TAXON_ID=2857 /ORGANISM="Nitzschia sp." /LENGTH=411 /DNA_ID=CAMNT_0000364135 /DNA_START=58 /DNA_END=1293 /DNA_ORIENTATION=- /assembly_acc=CAM_ASM_000159